MKCFNHDFSMFLNNAKMININLCIVFTAKSLMLSFLSIGLGLDNVQSFDYGNGPADYTVCGHTSTQNPRCTFTVKGEKIFL